MMSHKLTEDYARKAMLAGKAILTLKNKETGGRFTYKIKKHEVKPIWFVSVLTGLDNTSSYSYFATIFEDMEVRVTSNSRITDDAISVQGFKWVFKRLMSHIPLPEKLEIWHEGKCCRCGRKLTVPESIESGFGPECIKIHKVVPVQGRLNIHKL